MAPTLSVVIPTYNEAANIGPLLGELRRTMAGVDVEFLVVDDDSRDGTVDKARLAEPTARIIVRKGERGLATAVVLGIREAQGTFVAVMDADFQHPPAAVRAMLDRALLTQADLIVGSRYAAGGSEGNFGLARRTISKGARTIAKLALPPVRQFKLNDPMSGLFLVRRDRVDPLVLRPSGYKVLLEILAKCDLRRVEEVGYRFQSRRGGASKLGGAVMLQYLLHVLGLGLQHKENQRMLRFVLVGASGVAVNLGFLFAFVEFLAAPKTLAVLMAAEISIISNFLLNDTFTFRDRHTGPFVARMGMFHLVSLAGLIANLVAYLILHDLIGVYYILAAAIAIVCAFGVNFAGNMGFTYGKRRPAAREWVPIVVLLVASTGLYFSALDSVEDRYFDESYYLVVAHQMDAGIWMDPCPHDGNLDPMPLNYEHPPLAKLMMYASVHAYDSFNAANDPVNHGIFAGCRDPNCDPATNSGCIRKEACYVDDGTKLYAGKPCYDAWVKDMRAQGNPYAWRGASALMGVITVVFAALAARRLFASTMAGVLAGAFVLLDNLVLSSSRIALLDIFATGFMVVAVYFATFATRRGVFLTTLFLGLGFSCKFYVLFAGPPILLLSLWTHYHAGVLRKPRFTLHMLAYPIVPLGVFLATYTPWLVMWTKAKGIGWAFGHFIAVQAAAIKWDSTGKQTHDYVSPPSEWLAMVTPMNYLSSSKTYNVSDGTSYTLYRDIYAIGNPILWWGATVVVVAVILWLGARLAQAMLASARPPAPAVSVAPASGMPPAAQARAAALGPRAVAALVARSAPAGPPRTPQRPLVIPGAPILPPLVIRPLPARPTYSRFKTAWPPRRQNAISAALLLVLGLMALLSGIAGIRGVRLPSALAMFAFAPGPLVYTALAFAFGIAQLAMAVGLYLGKPRLAALQVILSALQVICSIAIMIPSGSGIGPGLGLFLLLHAALAALLAGKHFLRQPRPRQALLAGALLPLLTFLGFFALHSGGRSMFIFYMTLVVPLMAIAFAGVLAYLWRAHPIGKPIVVAACTLVALAFLWFLPVSLYLEIPRDGMRWMSEPIPGTNISIPYPGIGFHQIMDVIPWMHECGTRVVDDAVVHECSP